MSPFSIVGKMKDMFEIFTLLLVKAAVKVSNVITKRSESLRH